MWTFFIDHWRDGIEILFLATCIYQIYRAFRATRGAQILVGLGTILVVLTLVSTVFKFEVIQWIITRAAAVLAFALIVIFQPELRTGLARLGSNRLFSLYSSRRHDFLERFADAVHQSIEKTHRRAVRHPARRQPQGATRYRRAARRALFPGTRHDRVLPQSPAA